MAAEHCCVPQCVSDARNDSSLSFHTFPKADHLRKRWIVAIRRDEGPLFKITRKTFVCSKHFLPEDFKYTPVRKTLKPGIAPSVFPWNTEKKSRKAPSNRKPLQARDSSNLSSQSLENAAPQMPDVEPRDNDVETQTDQSLPDTQQLLLYIQQLEREKDQYQRQLYIERFGIERFSTDDEMVQYYTSFRSYHLFKKFFDFVQPCATSMCSMYYVCSNTISLAGRPRNMSLIDEMFMFFVRLRLGLPEQDLAVRFICHISTISRKIITWANFLYFILGSIPIWPSRVTVDRHMPPEFRLTYPSTRVILDCTEIKIQIPSALVLNSMFYSHYKGSCTLKGLIGIAPNGAVTFVSNLYTGVMSDVEITKLSGILDLFEPGDSVMADKGFTIASILSEKGVALNIPPFLHCSGQFTAEEVEDTQAIASLRIHVERLIRRVKENHMFDSTISIAELGSIYQQGKSERSSHTPACSLTASLTKIVKSHMF